MNDIEKNNIIKQLVVKNPNGDYLRINPETIISAVSKTEDDESEKLSNILDQKVDKSTTLDGYGISDAYTKTEIDNIISNIELPEQVGNEGKVLMTNGEVASWQNILSPITIKYY